MHSPFFDRSIGCFWERLKSNYLEEKLDFVESTARICETWFYSLESPSFHSSSTRKRSKVFESLRLLWILAEILRTSSWCSERNRVSCETVEISCLSNCNVCLYDVYLWETCWISNLKNYELPSCEETFIFWKIVEFCLEFENWQSKWLPYMTKLNSTLNYFFFIRFFHLLIFRIYNFLIYAPFDTYLLKYGFCKKSLRKNETLSQKCSTAQSFIFYKWLFTKSIF